MKKINRVGEINYNTYGSKMTIIDYVNWGNIVVKFDNGFIIKSNYQHFKEGILSNLYDKSVYNTGYIGEGKFKVSIDKKYTIYYSLWKDILRRCYNEESHKLHPTYIKCSVCEEWLNFQNFGKWHEENFYQLENYKMQIDKDILFKGNKIYSPETCVFVPQFINQLFCKSDITRGRYPIGVIENKKDNQSKKYISKLSIGNVSKNLGYYKTPEEAFQVYKEAKESYIKEVAEKYKSQIPEKLYNALLNYKVEITD